MSDDQGAFYQKTIEQFQVFLGYHILYFEQILPFQNDLRFFFFFILGLFTKNIFSRFRKDSRSAAFNLILNNCVSNNKVYIL